MRKWQRKGGNWILQRIKSNLVVEIKKQKNVFKTRKIDESAYRIRMKTMGCKEGVRLINNFPVTNKLPDIKVKSKPVNLNLIASCSIRDGFLGKNKLAVDLLVVILMRF